MAAYFFFDVHQVVDEPKMESYRQRVFETVAKHGGRYLVIGGPTEAIEGGWKPDFPVMIEFPSAEQARRWYDSADYAGLKSLRLAATRGDAVLMTGFQP